MLEGEVSGNARDELQRHLETCEPCHEAMLALVRDAGADETAVSTRREAPPRTKRAVADRPSLAPSLDVGASIDHYEVTEKLGRGGMGAVYLARDTKLGRRVALKVIRADSELPEKMLERFHLEAKAMARFSHPNIVSIYAVGEVHGAPYVALEYVRGETLRERLKRSVDLAEALRIGLDIAKALAEAHRHGIIHRDLKPDNVILGEDGRARVLDFGLAAFLTEGGEPPRSEGGTPPVSRVAVSSAMGTPRYMAPEQWLAKPLSGGTDVWALGLMLYEMCTGERPFEAESLEELGALHVEGRPAPAMSTVADVPFALDELVSRCLQREPELRPSAAIVQTALSNMTTPASADEVPSSKPAEGESLETMVSAKPLAGSDTRPATLVRSEPVMLWIGGALVVGAALGVGVMRYMSAGAESSPPAAEVATTATNEVRTEPLITERFRASAMGRYGGCAVEEPEFELVCWGLHTGNPNHTTSAHAVAVPGIRDVEAVQIGSHHRCARTKPGEVFCWGGNRYGQIGDGTTVTRLSPVKIEGMSNIKSLTVGANHACALTKERGISCWGSNAQGELGLGDTRERTRPTPVEGLPEGIVRISAGDGYTCAVTKAGAIYCSGRNHDGQLGFDPERRPRVLRFELVEGAPKVERIYTGVRHTCARSQGERKLICWGANDWGQLGDRTTTSRHKPAMSPLVESVSIVFPGVRHTCVLTRRYTVKCFGANDHGQLGTAPTDQPVLDPVLLADHAVHFGGKGSEHICFGAKEKPIVCTGLNDVGQLGDGTLETRSSPAPILRIE